jgi:hypothetical protein
LGVELTISGLRIGNIETVLASSIRAPCGLHWYLALSLAALGTASSFAATHIDAFTVYAYLTKDFTAMSALYTHHQYIAGFFLLGAFAHGAIYLIRDANLTILYRGFPDSGVALDLELSVSLSVALSVALDLELSVSLSVALGVFNQGSRHLERR